MLELFAYEFSYKLLNVCRVGCTVLAFDTSFNTFVLLGSFFGNGSVEDVTLLSVHVTHQLM
jgi:hypothetical protein